MSKKKRIYDDFEDDNIILDKKTKRRLERAAKEQEAQLQREEKRVVVENPEEAARTETMGKISAFGQESRWREALLLIHKAIREATEKGQDEFVSGLSMLAGKFEMNMRRQMAATYLSMSKETLRKEGLLDVCE